MAPVQRTGAIADGSKYFVKLNKGEQEENNFRPMLKKLKSCEFSVEESSSLYAQPIWEVKSSDAYSTTSFIGKGGRVDLNTVCLPSLEKQKQDLKSFLKDSDPKLFKLVKPRSPTENDDWSSSNAAITAKLVDEPSTSCIDLGLASEGEGERRESDQLVTVKEEEKKEKENAPLFHSAPQKKSKSKNSGIFKRQSIGKAKRNTWMILCQEATQQPDKKLKVKRKSKKRKNSRGKENGPIRSFQHKRDSSTMPTGYKCVDSGISEGSNCSSTSNGQQSGTYNNESCTSGGGGGGGGGGFCKKKGLGGNGRDDEENKRPLSAEDVNMEEEEEEEEEEDVKMSSKEGSDTMDCHAGQATVHSVQWETFKFNTTHLQHSCYCSDGCPRKLCKEMKGELGHFKTHQSGGECHRCQKVENLLKFHAATCKRGSCRVTNCNSLREKKNANELPGPCVLPPPPPPPPQATRIDIDGLVVFDNTGCNLKHQLFQELHNYTKGKEIGKGGNGNVYKVHFHLSSPFHKVPMVVKETRYTIKSEEVHAYVEIGDHPNILKHFIVAMKGHDGQASVFMEECNKSLKDLCNERHGKKMDDKEAIFYWRQVLDAVVHLHEKGIIHKDIKAQNILLSELAGSGECFRAKLADFDSAKKLEQEFTAEGLKPMGTPGFTSPEVLNQLPHGRPADVFSLGCMLMDIVGISPNQAKLQSQVQELIGIHAFLGGLVQCCVQEDYTMRPTALEIQYFLNTNVPEELM